MARGQWHAEIIRLSYDRTAAERDFEQSGFLDEGGPLARVMLKELQIAQGQLFRWITKFEKAVLSGRNDDGSIGAKISCAR